MTPERADELCAEVMRCQEEIDAAFKRMDIETINAMRLKIENINKEARRLNRIRQQKIVGTMGVPLGKR